jgi:dolichol-phosphate mannosyltransferase/undecaprenyl-phosphate 4-deoxy-4-formamido-L-arabinose transferase
MISIVVPVYNTSDSLMVLAERIDAVFSQTIKEKYELIFVDDASSNMKTWKTLLSIVQQNTNVKAIQLMRNFGQQGATICGLKESVGDYIITMDDDLQHMPEDIPKLLQKKGHDIVIAQFKVKQHSLPRRMASKIKGWFDFIIIGKPRHIQLSPFRLLSRQVVSGMLNISTPYPFIPALMFHISKDIVTIQATHGGREEGESGYSLVSMIKIFSNLIISNSSIMLKFIGLIGIVCSFLSFAAGAWFIYKKLVYGNIVPGWTSIIVSGLFLGGLMLFSMGIIGEYLIRIIAGVENKPTYYVRAKVGGEKN